MTQNTTIAVALKKNNGISMIWMGGLHFEEMPILSATSSNGIFSFNYGEQMALQCVQRLHNEIADPIQRELLEIQIQDERRHVVFFQRVLQSTSIVSIAGLFTKK